MIFIPYITNSPSMAPTTAIQAIAWTQSKLQTSVQIDEHSLNGCGGLLRPMDDELMKPYIHKIPEIHRWVTVLVLKWIHEFFTPINGTSTTTNTHTQNSASILARSGVQGLTGIVTNCVFTSYDNQRHEAFWIAGPLMDTFKETNTSSCK